jgi:hypothetical protein
MGSSPIGYYNLKGTMERIIPDLNNLMISLPLLGEEKSQENYLKKIIAFEQECEKSIIETLAKVDINATVKQDRYSLPFQKEVEVILYGESYLNGPYEFHRVARKIVRELLKQDLYKIRFYFFINLENSHLGFGRINYKFRYYIHE